MSDADIDSIIDRSIRTNLYEIATDDIGVGLCSIVRHGRVDAQIEGPELLAFVRRVIEGLVAGGATPEDGRFVTPDNPFGLAHFGTDTPAEIADGIAAAWAADGMPDPDWDDWCFNSAENRAWLAEVRESNAAATK